MANATQALIDTGQYVRDGIDAYEAVFGHDFVNPEGKRMTRRLIS